MGSIPIFRVILASGPNLGHWATEEIHVGTAMRGVLSRLRSRPLIGLRRLISHSPAFYHALYFAFELIQGYRSLLLCNAEHGFNCVD